MTSAAQEVGSGKEKLVYESFLSIYELITRSALATIVHSLLLAELILLE